MSYRIVGIGEILWDVIDGEKRLGGAPGNFACQAQALGASASIVSAVGKDAPGQEILDALEGRGFDIRTIALDPAHPTGTVTVETGPDGQPSYTIHEQVAWDYLEPTAAAREAVAEGDALCFGSLAQRHCVSREATRALVRSAKPDAWRVFDVNLRQHFYTEEVLISSLQLATALKLNDEELPILAELIGKGGSPVRECMEALAREYSLQAVALTRGANGSILLAGDDQWSEAEAVPIDAIDTVGAGDAFLAAFVMGLLHGLPLDDINQHANRLARHVCGSAGATPDIPADFRNLFPSGTSLSS